MHGSHCWLGGPILSPLVAAHMRAYGSPCPVFRDPDCFSIAARCFSLVTRLHHPPRLPHCLLLQVRFIVMGNVLPSDLRLHRRYDLKGSTYGRTAGAAERAENPHCTLKDNDVDMQVGAVMRGADVAPLWRRQLGAASNQLRLQVAQGPRRCGGSWPDWQPHCWVPAGT